MEELLSPKPSEAEEFFSDLMGKDFRPPSSLNTPEPEDVPLDVQPVAKAIYVLHFRSTEVDYRFAVDIAL